ncbi:MAG: hypothetical protein AAF483_12185 [Planctomycetota bacterium]
MSKCGFLAILFLVTSSFSLQAAIVTYTDPGLFNAAIAGRTNTTLNFDTTAVGTTIASGSAFGGLTFDYTWASGEELRINDDNDTNSGNNYLAASTATDGEDLIADENNFTMTPVMDASAFGVFVITQDEAFDGDLRLVSGTSQVDLAGPSLSTLGDGSHVYFLGFVANPDEILSPVNLEADILAFLLNYRADDIVFSEALAPPAPEPGSFLVCTGVLSLLNFRRRRAS